MDMIRIVLTLCVVPCIAAATVQAAQDERPTADELVSVELLSEQTAIAPGETAWVGLRFQIEPKWHIYWRYAGDSGAPPDVAFTTSENVEIGEAHWPGPERYVEADFLVNHVYHDEAMLLYPITVSEDTPVGSTVSIKADVNWLVCKEYCLMGGGKASIEIAINENGRPGDHSKRFEIAKERLPKEMKAADREGVKINWRGRTLVLAAAGADELAFFPRPASDDGDVLPSDDMVRAGAASKPLLEIEYGEDAERAPHVLGVLQVIRGKKSTYYQIDVKGPGASS